MGHCDMLLAVAGLDRQAVNERTRDLAGGDWSRFSPAEQAAFALARKVARSGTVPARQFQDLVARVGQDRALDVVWWVCQCHYMTRVAEAFRLPLEEGNVFDGFAADAERPEAP